MSGAGPPAPIDGLLDPGAYDHPVDAVRLLETHVSWVLLTGDYAYKIKKPVDFGFLDFSTLARRRHYCAEEIRLNRRLAPQLYLGLAEIRDCAGRPRLGGDGPVIEYAVKMREFAQRRLLSVQAAENRLAGATIDRLGDALARFHGGLPPADPASGHGGAERVLGWCRDNLEQIDAALPAASRPPVFDRLREWYRDEACWRPQIEARRREGFVRECHGDLHLRNIVLLDERPVFFDCIEFDPELRWIDTTCETAFLAMDLEAKGYPGYAWRFIDRYLERGGDYAALALLRFYVVYRALVRAKIDALRATQATTDAAQCRDLRALAIAHIELAARWASSARPGLVLMHGPSGAGKSTAAAQLVERLGAPRLRADVERKRLHGIDPDAASGSPLGGGIYAPAATEATYRRLADLADGAIAAGFIAIVDAASLAAWQRRLLIDVAARRRCAAVIVDCAAPPAELRRRLAARGADPSEATAAVLARQLDNRDPLRGPEREGAVTVRLADGVIDAASLAAIDAALHSPAVPGPG